MAMIEIVSIGDRIFPGGYKLHSRFRQVLNFTDGDSLAALVTEEVGKGPVNIVIRGRLPVRIDTLEIDGEEIRFNDQVLSYDRDKIFNSRIVTGTINAGRLRENLEVFQEVLVELAPPKSLVFLIDEKREVNFASSFEKGFTARIKEGVEHLLNSPGFLTGDRREDAVRIFRSARPGSRTEVLHYEHPFEEKFHRGIRMIKGLGFGLTPSGDDFIAGFLVGLNLMERLDRIDRSDQKGEIVSISRSDNLLSNSFIALAGGGYLYEAFKNLLSSLTGGKADEVRSAVENLLSLGASSGADMGVGFLLLMKNLLDS